MAEQEIRFTKYIIPLSSGGVVIRKNTSDWRVFKRIFISQEYEFPINFEPKLIIDGGANVGYASLFFANKFPKAEIFSIEPERSNFEALKKNVSNFKQIKPIRAGLWHKKAYLKVLDVGLDEWGFRTQETGANDYDIEAITLDEVLRQSRYNEIDILKLDIEGAEKELFSENYDSWLSRVNVVIIELHDRMKEGCSDAFYRAIKKYNFEQTRRGKIAFCFKK